MFVLKNRLMEGEGEGKGGNSGSGDNTVVIKKAVEEATAAMHKKNSELLSELKQTKEAAKKFEGLDLEKLTALQKHMNDSEEAKLIADGKFDEVFDRRFQRVREDYDTKLTAANTKGEENEKLAGHYKNLYSKEKIRNSAIRACEKAGVSAEAIDDAVDKVMSRFQLDDKGSLEARDETGSLVMSKDGKNVLQPAEYIEEVIKPKYPYYWPINQSGRLGGASGGVGGGGASGAEDKAAVAAAGAKNMADFRRLRTKQRSSN